MLNKLQLQNLAWTSISNPCAQSLNKNLALGPNVSSQICNKLLPTCSSASTSAIVTTSTSLDLASSHARVTSIKFTKRQSVSESVTDKHCQWKSALSSSTQLLLHESYLERKWRVSYRLVRMVGYTMFLTFFSFHKSSKSISILLYNLIHNLDNFIS